MKVYFPHSLQRYCIQLLLSNGLILISKIESYAESESLPYILIRIGEMYRMLKNTMANASSLLLFLLLLLSSLYSLGFTMFGCSNVYSWYLGFIYQELNGKMFVKPFSVNWKPKKEKETRPLVKSSIVLLLGKISSLLQSIGELLAKAG
ncbi:hypothetical protein J3Q64DRAFT_1696575 [Phycomyces blakesleeanus]|uniref:Uncharacterized protein n=2 Tax=Phycomyces blakesleeanus TaxID=4837 RepID=A0A167NPD8_PHYB8|nr:hypothetical protein PHYBLDRAFT_186263 [Phycomyces blakesleeanus NRRL 1555(-)]OAD76389.1 hypothetical protein PHYBLDRAFT_186263 [Phycomyces blakesleeanus NRRL 1555(-)]|eukprot:XP_018294429.1 hypothetical protein PHYBLDRAFT_186263 [Phycomyces blakesleeanus NRRL 1555(-)]